MIVTLVGKSGAGKTLLAEALERITPGSFVIDGDDLRAETQNVDIGLSGRERNMHLGFKRARWLSDNGFTVFIAMQAPIKEIRNMYLTEGDITVEVTNSGWNPKNEAGYNKHFSADYSDRDFVIDLQDYINYNSEEIQVNAELLWNAIIPKVLVISRFQGFHTGHQLIMETAKRISPNITIALRNDPGDLLDLEKNIELLKSKGYKVIKSPGIIANDIVWENFVKRFDIVVQGNPDVIKKFDGRSGKEINKFLSNTTPSGPCDLIFDNGVHLKYVPRIGNISATKIREAIKNGDLNFAKNYVSNEVLEFLKEELDTKEENEIKKPPSN